MLKLAPTHNVQFNSCTIIKFLNVQGRCQMTYIGNPYVQRASVLCM